MPRISLILTLNHLSSHCLQKDNSNYRRNRSSSRARAEKKPSAPTRRRSPQLPFTRKEAFSELEAAPDHPTVSRTKRSRSRSAVESLERPRKKARARRSLTSVATRHSARIEAKKLSLTDKEPSSDLLIRKEPRISFSFSNKELHGGQTSETSSKASSKDSIDERVLENFMELDDFNLLPHTFDPCKFTMTIAPHDMRNVGKVLEAPEYVTDIFHRLFQLEVSQGEMAIVFTFGSAYCFRLLLSVIVSHSSCLHNRLPTAYSTTLTSNRTFRRTCAPF
jgi:hypothetical protein